MKKSSFWKSFFRGISHLFIWNFDCRSYEERFGSDTEQLTSDWKKVGDDIRHAVQQFEKKLKK